MAKDVINLWILRGLFLFCVIHYMYPYKRDMDEDLVQTHRGEGDVMTEAETEVM